MLKAEDFIVPGSSSKPTPKQKSPRHWTANKRRKVAQWGALLKLERAWPQK